MAKLTGPELCEAELKSLLKRDRKVYYTTPSLNDQLYIHYRGYRRLQALEPFTGLKVLYAEGNGFRKLEGLDECQKLRCLYVQENCIEKIEGVDKLKDLHTVNLSNNFIETIEGLGENGSLGTLIIQKNRVGTNGLSDVTELRNYKAITVLDVSDNQIDDPAILDEVLVDMPALTVLYLKGNPVVKRIPNYRKTVINTLKNLRYLDDRPVFPDDRRCAEAFCRGGFPEERQERRIIQEEKRDEQKRNHDAFRRLIQEARQEKAERDKMEAEDDPQLAIHEHWRQKEKRRYYDEEEDSDQEREQHFRGVAQDIQQQEQNHHHHNDGIYAERRPSALSRHSTDLPGSCSERANTREDFDDTESALRAQQTVQSFSFAGPQQDEKQQSGSKGGEGERDDIWGEGDGEGEGPERGEEKPTKIAIVEEEEEDSADEGEEGEKDLPPMERFEEDQGDNGPPPLIDNKRDADTKTETEHQGAKKAKPSPAPAPAPAPAPSSSFYEHPFIPWASHDDPKDKDKDTDKCSTTAMPAPSAEAMGRKVVQTIQKDKEGGGEQGDGKSMEALD
ncbi:unnamed protein product [Vitrella brassicaformis CCMP3155]|uniref:U2A'/phosphoprotein 32 family A C-terminal domain-containing protein n=1 Tax=Vitrella brassicaformis (strain CCMP3155) TaxID=1169540 RepID=A0A0G4FTP9_VITBC|nr:unnamed protein product [Vitrella brassicaformis CCMP3155]|eukprot:CEM17740.1 unnamed protein product [Vitrella brassicaformis CCMP3155]